MFAPRLAAHGAIVAALLSFAAQSATAGQDVWTDTTLGEGVLWRQKTYTSLYGGKQTVNVLEVDLQNPNVTIRAIQPGSGCATTSSQGSGAKALAAVNGGFFDGSCNSLSMVKTDGSVTATNPGYKPARATLGINSATRTAYVDWIASTNSWSAVDQAMGGGPNLVSSGASDVTLSEEEFDSSYASKNPRTAAGVTSAGKVLLVTVDGRTSAGVGMTLSELASYMIALGCNEAMNLDGGGSTTMWTSADGVVNTPSDGSQRSVVGAICVYADGEIVDNGAAGYAEVGTWTSSANSGYYGTNSRWNSTGTGADTATWTPTLEEPGQYDVYAWWVAGSNRATNAVYNINAYGATGNIPANQTLSGGKWNLLGNYAFAEGTAGSVVLTDNAEASKVVSADAVRFVWKGKAVVVQDNVSPNFAASANWWTSTSTSGYLGANYHVRATAPGVTDQATWVVPLPGDGSYKVYARWTSGTNRSAAAPYQIVHTGGTATVLANQQANNGAWVLLGTWSFYKGLSAVRVKLGCDATAGYYVVADGVKFEKQ